MGAKADMLSEARISAIVVSLLTGAGLTLVLSEALRSLAFALTFTVPITLVMAAVLALLASDNIKQSGSGRSRKTPTSGPTEGN